MLQHHSILGRPRRGHLMLAQQSVIHLLSVTISDVCGHSPTVRLSRDEESELLADGWVSNVVADQAGTMEVDVFSCTVFVDRAHT